MKNYPDELLKMNNESYEQIMLGTTDGVSTSNVDQILSEFYNEENEKEEEQIPITLEDCLKFSDLVGDGLFKCGLPASFDAFVEPSETIEDGTEEVDLESIDHVANDAQIVAFLQGVQEKGFAPYAAAALKKDGFNINNLLDYSNTIKTN